MAKKPEDYTTIGCAVVVAGLTLLWGLVVLVEAYCRNVQLAEAVFGGVLGTPVGAGIAALVCQSRKGYRKKAEVGPLPRLAHFSHLVRLRRKYLGVEGVPPPIPHQPEASQRRPSKPAAAILVDAAEEGADR
jgi:hypothetical protein